MKQFKSNQDFYNYIDELCVRLKWLGFNGIATKLHQLIHETAWTTSSELLGEMRIALREFRAENEANLNTALDSDIDMCLKTINSAFNAANSGWKD